MPTGESELGAGRWKSRTCDFSPEVNAENPKVIFKKNPETAPAILIADPGILEAMLRILKPTDRPKSIPANPKARSTGSELAQPSRPAG